MRFAAPLWLIGLLALAIPIALHLRGDRRGPAVKVGSLRWLEAQPASRMASTRLTRVWLLLLRCAVIAAVVLALAAPSVTRRMSTSGAWVLVVPEVARQAPLDSLRNLGDVRALSGGLPGIDAVPPPMAPTDVWSLLREADAVAPVGTRFVVVAPTASRFYRGVRPRLAREIDWVTADPPQLAPQAAPRRGAVILVAAANRSEDARYLAAAFKAVGAVHGDSVRVELGTSAANAAALASGDWLAWLGDSPPPSEVGSRVREGLRLITDADTLPLDLGDRVVWRAADGAPLLVARDTGRGTHFRLRSRFHPSSWPLVLEPEFASLVDSLWSPGTPHDLPLSLQERTPSAHGASVASTLPDERASRPLLPLLLLAIVCFLAERALTAREPAT